MFEQQVVDLSRTGELTFEEAFERSRILKKLTGKYVEQVEARMSRLESLDSKDLDLILQLEKEVNQLIYEWHSKVRKLAGTPKGLWLVVFDSGFGYYCWKYPENCLEYWHSYAEGYESRKRICLEELPVLRSQNQVNPSL